MNFNTILVQLDLVSPAAPRLTFGWELARRFEADMVAFAAAEPTMIVPVGDHGAAAAHAYRLQVEAIEARLKAIEQEFQAITKDDQRASWRALVGDPTTKLALHARAADLVVAAASAAQSPSRSRGIVDPGALILAAGRPVLMPAEDFAAIQTDGVVIGWKDTREARRAVVDAMPFLTEAKDVAVVTVEEEEMKTAKASAADVARFLMKHGVKAHPVVIDVGASQAVDALEAIAADIGANLVIAGGYGHSRLREWAFGGVTRSLLAQGGLHRLFSN
jgi:nucleotide-binding universal stress UspA family protein